MLTALLTALTLTLTAAPGQTPVECDETAAYGQDGCGTGTTCMVVSSLDGFVYGSECVPLSCIYSEGEDPSTDTERPLAGVDSELEDCADYAK